LKPLNLAVLASGRGSNLRAIVEAIDQGRLNAHVRVVVSNKAQAGALDFARQRGIPAIFLSPEEYPSPEAFDQKLLEVFEAHGVDFIALAGYLRLISPVVIERYRNRIVNIHPALLPAFGGKGMYGPRVHEAVLDYGCKVTGVTVHLVDEQYDHGPVLLQRCVEVRDDDTPESLADRVLKIEHQLYAEALQLFAEGRVKVVGRRVFIENRR